MKPPRTFLTAAALIAVVVPATAEAKPQRPADNKACQAQRALLGSTAFRAAYRNHADCVRARVRAREAARRAAAAPAPAPAPVVPEAPVVEAPVVVPSAEAPAPEARSGGPNPRVKGSPGNNGNGNAYGHAKRTPGA